MQTIGSIHAREQLSDGALIEQVLSGDQAAFEILVHRYEMELYRFALRCLRDYEQAKDVVQFVFLQLYSFLPGYRGISAQRGARRRSNPGSSRWPSIAVGKKYASIILYASQI